MGDSVSKKELDGILSDFDALKAEHNIDWIIVSATESIRSVSKCKIKLTNS
jgi:hypothetical protein